MLPFIIAGFAVAGAVTTYNVKKGIDKKKKADGIKKEMERKYKYNRSRLYNLKKKLIDMYGTIDSEYINTYENEFVRFKQIVEKVVSTEVHLKEISGVGDSIDIFIKESKFIEKSLDTIKIFKEMAKASVTGIISGGLSVAGVTGVASAIGTASTGTAISSLSGIAFEKALLAYLGGGSLATGGFGVAGGTAVLGGVAVAPVLVIMSIAFEKSMDDYLTETVKWKRKIAYTIEDIKNEIHKIKLHMEHVEIYLEYFKKLREQLSALLNDLERTIAEENFSVKEIENKLNKAYLLVKTLREIMDKPLEKNLMEYTN